MEFIEKIKWILKGDITMDEVVIIGGGGHAKVIMDIILKNKEIGRGIDLLGFYDDDSSKQEVCGVPVLGSIDEVNKLIKTNKNTKIIVGIGDNKTRMQIVDKINIRGNNYLTAIHPSAIIGNKVNIKQGTVVVAGAVINIDTRIGEHCIINTCASVGHDILIGDFVHISPGVRLTGGVRIGNNVHIGAGAVVIPEVSIGENSIIGAGAVVTKDIPANCTAVGVPAKPIKFYDNIK